MLSGIKGGSCASAAQEGAAEGAVEAVAGPWQYAKLRCSICESTEHNTRMCPKWQATS